MEYMIGYKPGCPLQIYKLIRMRIYDTRAMSFGSVHATVLLENSKL